MGPIERQHLARTLRHLRLGKGLRQIDLAIPGKISRSAISALERAQIENPSKQLVTAVATALDVRYEDLMGFSDAEASVVTLLQEARLLWQHDPKKAVRDAQRALARSRRLQLYDMEQDVAALLAEWYGLCGDPFRAAAYSMWVLSHPYTTDPEQLVAVSALAKHLRKLGEWRAGIALYRQFLFGIHRANPRFGPVFLQLGQTYAEAHQYARAGRAFTRAHRDAIALGQAEEGGWALVGLSQTLGFRGRHEEAATANNLARSLSITYRWSDLGSATLRTDEILNVLSSRSLTTARQQWHRAATLLQKNSGAIQEQLDLLHGWIHYALIHQSWEEVLLATDSGLALLRSPTHLVNRGAKGQLLWARAYAKRASGHPWKHDREWAADLLHIDRTDITAGPNYLG